MKKVFLSLITLLYSFTAMALTLNFGSLECLKGQKNIVVSLDLTNTTYMSNYTVEEFLNKAPRSKNWKEGSIRQFVTEFNEKTNKIGLKVVDEGETEYELQIVPGNINSAGEFVKVEVNVIKKSTNELMASMTLDTDDGDKNDEIAFRDTMGELGERLGSFFNLKLKKINNK
jgi:hypothetical protein